MNHIAKLIALACAVPALLSAPATSAPLRNSGQIYNAVSVTDIETLMAELGISTERIAVRDTEAALVGSISPTEPTIGIILHECSAQATNCLGVLFFFFMDAGSPTPSLLNTYNAAFPVGKAFVVDGQTIVQVSRAMTGGVTRDHIASGVGQAYIAGQVYLQLAKGRTGLEVKAPGSPTSAYAGAGSPATKFIRALTDAGMRPVDGASEGALTQKGSLTGLMLYHALRTPKPFSE